MSEIEFWQRVYLIQIEAGAGVNEAKHVANLALERMRHSIKELELQKETKDEQV